MLPSVAILVLLRLLACAKPGQPEQPIGFCESNLAYAYDPAVALTTFPDDWWTISDTSTATGLRVHIEPDDPALSDFPENYRNLVTQLGTLDGFGLTPA